MRDKIKNIENNKDLIISENQNLDDNNLNESNLNDDVIYELENKLIEGKYQIQFSFTIEELDDEILLLKDDIQKEKEKKNDLQIIKKIILEQNPNYFSYFEKKYKNLLRNAIRKMIKDEDQVDDLLQITLVKAYTRLDTYKLGFSFSSWIYRIASNNCIDFMRKKKLNLMSINQTVNLDGEEVVYEIPDKDYVPDVNMINEEKTNALQYAIGQLPENYKYIIHLRHTEDLDYAEISEKLNMPLGTVKAHLFRARKMLYEALKDKQYLFR